MKKWAGIAVGLLLLAIAAMAVAIPLAMSRTERAILASRDAARAAGYPTNTAELDEWYVRVPVDRNAATYAEPAFAKLDLRRLLEKEEPRIPLADRAARAPLPLTGPLDPGVRAAVEGFLAENAESLELLHRAASCTEARYTVDYAEPYDTHFERFGQAGVGAALLALEAVLAAEAGYTDKALSGLEDCLRFVETLAGDPVMSAQDERYWAQHNVLQVLNRILNRHALTDEQLSRIAALLQNVENNDTYYRGIAGWRCNGEAMIDQWIQYNEDLGLGHPVEYLRLRLGFVERDRRWFLECMDAVLEACRAPVDERFDRIEATRAVIRRRPMFTSDYYGGPMLTEDNCEFFQGHLWAFARLRCARAALAVERYRLAHGALPETLDDLVPEYLKGVPLDPFAKAPLKYLRKDGGYSVYSVGRDRKDDGGIDVFEAYKRKMKPGSGDHVFGVERQEVAAAP